jgi:hypothetical protein
MDRKKMIPAPRARRAKYALSGRRDKTTSGLTRNFVASGRNRNGDRRCPGVSTSTATASVFRRFAFVILLIVIGSVELERDSIFCLTMIVSQNGPLFPIVPRRLCFDSYRAVNAFGFSTRCRSAYLHSSVVGVRSRCPCAAQNLSPGN